MVGRGAARERARMERRGRRESFIVSDAGTREGGYGSRLWSPKLGLTTSA